MTDVCLILKNSKHIYFLLQISWRDPAPKTFKPKGSQFVCGFLLIHFKKEWNKNKL